MTNKQKAIGLIFLGALLGGGISPLVKLGLADLPPFIFIWLRSFLSLIFILPFYFKARPRFDQNRAGLVLVAFLPVINMTLFAFGVRLTTATIAQAIYTGTPFLVAGLSFIVLKKRLSPQELVGLIVGLFGVILIIFLPIWQKGLGFSGNFFGNLTVVIAMVFWSLYQVFSKKIQKHYSPVVIITFFIGLSLLITAPLALWELFSGNFKVVLTLQVVLALFYIAAFGTAGIYILYQYAIKFGSPLIASLGLYLQPAFTFLWAAILLGERLTPGLILGASLALFGVWLASYNLKVKA